MVTEVAELTLIVVTENVPVVLPAGIVMLAGTVATAVLLLVSVTTAPPVGAAADSVTVPCELTPPNIVVGDTATELTATPVPCVTLPPILSVGSTDAYCRTNTLLNSATVPLSPYSATPPVARLLSVPCTSSTPSLYTSMLFPYTFTINWYHVFALTAPTAASPSVVAELFSHLYRYRLFVLFRSSYRFAEYRLLFVFTRVPTPHTRPLICLPYACST